MQPVLADMGRLPSGLDDLDPRRTRKLVTATRLTDQDLAREFSYSRAASRDEAQDDDEPRRFLGRGWLFWLVLDLSLIALPVPLVVMVPPVMHCRHIEANVGFFAGDSFTGCAVDGIKDRWALLDSRIKMLVRQSGR